MKKIKNKHGKKFSRLIDEIRTLIKKFAHHHTTMAYLLAPGLSSLFSNDFPKDLEAILSDNNSMPFTLPRTFKEIYNDETEKLQKKYKKINLYNMYWQIRREDINNFSLNNYKIDIRDTSYIDENGRKVITL